MARQFTQPITMSAQKLLSPQALSQIYQMLNQMRATGRVVTPKDVEAAYKAALEAEASKALQNRSQELQRQNLDLQRQQMFQNQQNWQRQFNFQREQYANRQNADQMAGIGMLGSLLFQGLKPSGEGGISSSPIGSMVSWLAGDRGSTPSAPTPSLNWMSSAPTGIYNRLLQGLSPTPAASFMGGAGPLENIATLAAPAEGISDALGAADILGDMNFDFGSPMDAWSSGAEDMFNPLSDWMSSGEDFGFNFMDSISDTVSDLFSGLGDLF